LANISDFGVVRPAQIGTNRDHACRQETPYYLPDDDSQVVATTHSAHAKAAQLSSSDVAAAVRQIQRNEQRKERSGSFNMPSC
jgi:hypothetical protein